jgi:hypothetical protein
MELAAAVPKTIFEWSRPSPGLIIGQDREANDWPTVIILYAVIVVENSSNNPMAAGTAPLDRIGTAACVSSPIDRWRRPAL